MTERRWKFSQIISLSFVGLLLAAAIVGSFGGDAALLSEKVIEQPIVVGPRS